MREANLVSVVRPLDEIQLAHDVLEDVVTGETPLPLDDASREVMGTCASVLCWVLSHPGGENFEIQFKKLVEVLGELGVTYEPGERNAPRVEKPPFDPNMN